MASPQLEDGFVLLHRKALQKHWLKNHRLWAFWCWCLLKASHKEHTQIVGYQEIRLMPGQFVFGRKKAAVELGMTERQIRTCVSALKIGQNIVLQATNRFSILSIVNWDSYQHPLKGKRPTKGPATDQQVTTNNNGNNGNKEKNIYGEFVLLTDDEYRKLVSQFGEEGTKERIEALNIGIGSKGYKYKSHYHTILSWERKDKKPEVKKPLGGLAY